MQIFETFFLHYLVYVLQMLTTYLLTYLLIVNLTSYHYTTLLLHSKAHNIIILFYTKNKLQQSTSF